MKKIALATLLLAASASPGFCAGYDDLNAAISYFNQAQYDNAITWFDKALAAGDLIPDQVRIAHLDRGDAYMHKGNGQKGLEDFTAAIAAKPDDPMVYRNRAAIYIALNERAKALADFEKLRELRPRNLNTLMNIGWLNWQVGNIEEAAKDFKFFALIDHYSWLWLQLANVRLGRPMDDFSEDVASRKWPGQVARFFRGHLSESDVLEAAAATGGADSICAGNILTGLWRVVHGDQAGAAPLFQAAKTKCPSTSTYQHIADSELEKTASAEKRK
jgi:tetratricopeptide (TPR) repeat protein